MRVITSNEHAKAIPGYLIDAFVSSLDGELINPRSRSNYRNALRAVERYLFDEMLVMEEIDSGIVQDVRDWMLSEYSPGTARNYFSVFRSFLSWFEGLGGGGAHTASRLSMPSHDASGVAVLTEGQAFSVMSAATDGATAEISARDGAIVALMLFCAFGVTDVEEANVGDVSNAAPTASSPSGDGAARRRALLSLSAGPRGRCSLRSRRGRRPDTSLQARRERNRLSSRPCRTERAETGSPPALSGRSSRR